MNRITDPLILSNWIRLIVLFIFIVYIHGCVVLKHPQIKYWSVSGRLLDTIERNDFPVMKEDDIIGQLAVMRLDKGDTLPDVARHFSLGINEIGVANPGVDIWVPEAGSRIILPLCFILPDTNREGIVINLAAMRLFQYKRVGESLMVSTYPIGIGSEERPTPMGKMYVYRKMIRPTWYVPFSIAEDHRKKGDPLPEKVLPGPQNPLGEYALYLNEPSYLIHGTNKPYSIGLRATNGCIRLYPEDIKKLYESTPVTTPVCVIDQPYLIAQRNGSVYIEVHTPTGDSGVVELEKMYVKLRNIEKKSALTIDWRKVDEALAEARGIPICISNSRQGSEKEAARIMEVKHPENLYGRPEIPELQLGAWYVLAADLYDEVEATRIAAIISHQGPSIPTRVLSKDNSHRVIAGPFKEISEAEDTIRRLKIDLEMIGILIEPTIKK